MSISLAGKVCLITGASSGIGAATAIKFANLGANVAISGRNEQALKDTVEKCAKASGGKSQVHCIVADLASAADRERLVSESVKHFGKLDCLVNNAGILYMGSVEAPNVMEQYDKIMEVNTKAPLHLMNLAVPHLIATKGTVVNVSSVNGIRAVCDSFFVFLSCNNLCFLSLTSSLDSSRIIHQKQLWTKLRLVQL